MRTYAENPYHERIIFWALLSIMIPSIFCSLYLFYQFYKIRILRTRTSNHLVLLLLVINFMQVQTSFRSDVDVRYEICFFSFTLRSLLSYQLISMYSTRVLSRFKRIHSASFGIFTISFWLQLDCLLLPMAVSSGI